MKHWLLVFMVLVSVNVAAQTVTQRFDKAVVLYKAGKYKESEGLLKPLVEKFHRTDGALLYNLAADEFRLHHPGLALYYLLMAQRSGNPAVRQAAKAGARRLRQYLTRAQAKQKSAMRRFLFQPYHDYMITTFGWANLNYAIWFSLVAWFFGLVFLGIFRLGRARRYAGKVAVVLLILAFAGAGVAAGKYHVTHDYRLGVLVQNTGIYKSVDNLDPQSYLPEGLEVRVLRQAGTLTRIRLVDGSDGFVRSDRIKVLQGTGDSTP